MGLTEMKKKRARTGTGIVLALLLFGQMMFGTGGTVVLAGAGAGGEAGEPLHLSLQQAVELAVADNVQLLQDRLGADTARINLDQVEALSLIEPSPTLLLQAETGLELARRNVALQERQIAFDVESAYYDVLRLQNVLHVLDDAIKMTERQLEVAESRRRTGVATEIDVLQARTALMQLESDRDDALDGLELVFARLRQMLGLAPGTVLILDETVITHEPVDMTLAAAQEEALQQRIELAQVRLAVDVAERELQLATNDYTPELNRVKAGVELEQARLQLRQAQDGIVLDVHNAYNEMRAAHRGMAVAEQRLAEMEENNRIVAALFEARMATDVEVLQGQAGLTEARTAVVHATFDYNAARAAFFQAIAREFDGR